MTEGVSKGLFLTVAIVIFGIFVVMADNILGLNLTTGLVGLFTQATEQVEADIGNTDQTVIPKENPDFEWNLNVPDDTNIIFEDTKLKKIVADTLGVDISEVTFGKLKGLVQITIPDEANITSFKGLDYAVNLENMNLGSEGASNLNLLGVLPVQTSVVSPDLGKGDGSSVPTDLPSKNAIFIRDIFLRSAIRKELGIKEPQPITAGDMLLLTKLNAENKGIMYLDGLGYAKNLTYLDVSHNFITYANLLKNHTKLTYVDISYNLASKKTLAEVLINVKDSNIVSNRP